MRRLFSAFVLALAPLASTAQTEVDLELVLAVDISRSMDVEELRLQRDGYVAALRDPEVHHVIAQGLLGRIAVLYMEWSGPSTLIPLGGWTLIDGPETAAPLADLLAGTRLNSGVGTSISGAIDFAVAAFRDNGFDGMRRVIDVSGDGPNNAGRPVTEARDDALAKGIVINGLPVMLRPGGPPFGLAELDVYYEDCVIGGPFSFSLPVQAPEALAETIRRKLILDIAAVPERRPETAAVVPVQFGLAPPTTGPRVDCMIGETLRRRWMQQRWGD